MRMTPASVIREAIGNANVNALLGVIRQGESSHDESAWTVLYGGGHFDGFADHPRIDFPLPDGRTTSAAGAFQIIRTTWDGLRRQYPDELLDFSPDSQTFAAVALIAGRGALDDVLAGRFDAAVAKLRKEWTSLPGAAESRSTWTLERARALYMQLGGKLEQETTMADEPQDKLGNVLDVVSTVAPLVGGPVGMIAGLAAQLFKGFSGPAKAKVEKELARHTDPATAAMLAQNAIDIVTSVTKTKDPVVAVAKAQADPAVMAQVAEATAAKFSDLAPALDRLAALQQQEWDADEASKRLAAERAAGEAWDMGPFIVRASFFAFGALLAFVFLIAGWQTFKTDAPSTEVWAAVTGILGFVTGVIATMVAYRYGTSRSSAAKDAMMQQVAAKRA